jgi:hypothetical protein
VSGESVFFATPVYRTDPLVALAWAKKVVEDLGLSSSHISFTMNTPWLHVAQAQLIAEFLWRTECDWLFFRDDDLFVEPSVVGRMLALQADVAVAPYRLRGETRFDVMLDNKGEVQFAGTGCCLVRRKVLRTLWDRYHEELHFRQNDQEVVALCRDMFVMRDDGVQLLKPDHAFHLRVRLSGFRIQALHDVETVHAGVFSHYMA